MKIVFTGTGTSGSWQIRGLQLGRAVGASVLPDAHDMTGFNLAVIVKRARPDLLARIQKSKIPYVLDILDGWPQPVGNTWDRATILGWLRQHIAKIRPHAIVAATQAMAHDCAQFGVPVLWLPHHARPNQAVNPIRERVKKVGYQGGSNYLGQWQKLLTRLCRDAGWQFLPNADGEIADLDIVVALREADGYAPRHYKSNVKLANAMGSGTPFIGSPEFGYMETACGVEYFANDDKELMWALTALTSHETRQRASKALLAAKPTLEHLSSVYLKWLHQV